MKRLVVHLQLFTETQITNRDTLLQAEMKGQIRDELGVAFRKLTEHARYIAQVSTESKIALVPEEYINSFKPALMEPVYKWCHGASFAEICKVS